MLPDAKSPSRYVDADFYNSCAQIAVAFRNIIPGRGMSLVLTEDLSLVGLASDDAGGISQTESDIDLPEIVFVKPGDAINPEHWNAIVTVTNAFSNLMATSGIVLTKSDEQFIIEMVGQGGTAGTSGAVALIEKLTTPFPSRDFAERLEKRLDVILHMLARNGLELIVSKTNVILQLSGAPLPAIVDEDTTPAACALPNNDYTMGVIISLNGALNSNTCGGILTEGIEFTNIVGILGTEGCLYRYRLTFEAKLPANGLGSQAYAQISIGIGDTGFIKITGDDGPTGCGMITKTVTVIMDIAPTDPPSGGGAMDLFMPDPSIAGWNDAYCKVAAMEFLGSRRV